MQFDVKEIDNVNRHVLVKIEPEELYKIEEKILGKLQKSVSIPGFRKGRAPKGLLKKSYGDSIKAEIMEKVLSDNYNDVIDKVNFKPISYGKITNIKFDDIQNGLEFTIELEVDPPIAEVKYKGLNVELETVKVTDEILEAELTRLQNEYATITALDKSEEGSYITFNAQLLGEGDIPIVGRKVEAFTVKIGSGELDPVFEEQLVGLELDSEAVIRKSVTLPPEAEEQNHQTESYKIKVTNIEDREFPPLDDEFVKNINDDKIKTLEQLKEVLHDALQTNLNERSRQQLRNRLIDELLKENPCEIPESRITHYLDFMVEDFKKNYPNKTVDAPDIHKKYRPDAIYTLRWLLLKQHVIKAENVEVPNSEIQESIDLLHYSVSEKEKLRQDENFVQRVQEEIMYEKVLKILEDNANITEIFPQPVKP